MPINLYDDYPLSWEPQKEKLTAPIYKSLIQLLEEDIISGKLMKNTRLPSQRELADFLDINFTTVGQAYKYGVAKGLLYTNIGSGTFVSQNAFQSITISTNKVPNSIIDLGLVSSFEECNELVVPYIQQVSQQQNLISLLDYRNPVGTRYQLETACRFLQNLAVATSEENIMIASGVQNGITIALSALFSPGNRIAVDRYTYPNFLELAKLFHLEIVLIDYDEEGMLPELLEKECQKKQIHGIFLMTSCSNPLGFQISAQRRQALAAVLEKHHLIIIEDEIHAFLTTPFEQEKLPPIQSLLPEQTIYLSGMTKALCSGLRVAYLVHPKGWSEKIQKANFGINVKAPAFDAEVITKILNAEAADLIMSKKKSLAVQANQLFDSFFTTDYHGHPWPYYRCIPVSPNISQHWIENYFNELGLRVYHSNRFTTQKQPDPFIRISLSSNNLEVLAFALGILKKGLQADAFTAKAEH